MRKPVRFETSYDFKAMYLPPHEIPVVDLFLRPGQVDLPCCEGGYLTLRLREGTDVGDTEYLVCMLNQFVEVVAYTVPPHKQERTLVENMGEALFETAEEARCSDEDIGLMMCTDSVRALAEDIGSEQTKNILRSLIEAVDEPGPVAPNDSGGQVLH